MAFRNVAFPLLSGGAVLLGYAAFSWLRAKRTLVSSEPTTLREAGLLERLPLPTPESEMLGTDTDFDLDASEGPLSERSPTLPEVLELDLDFEDELPAEHEGSLHDSVAPEDIGALFLARATDALSPFGDHSERDRFDPDRFSLESSLLSEATARAANGEEGLDPLEEPEFVTESERRPSNGARGGVR